MKKTLLTLVLLVGMVFGLFAQNLTYQAVIRDNNQQLVVNTDVKATVTITFTTGTPTTYSEEVNATTNNHGLLSIEFGGATLNGRDWTNATIAVKVVNAATPSTVYVNDDARPVSAVPYALSVNGQSIQNYLTEHHYVDKTELDSRHYLTSDSTVITTMQGNISTNTTNIGNLILHTTQDAIRDSVAGQIHDSIKTVAAKAHTHDNKDLLDAYDQTNTNLADAVAKKHAHDNADILNNTTATYTDDDSTKLDGIAKGAEVNVQSDWDQTDNSKDDFIKNKPTIPTTVAELSDAGNYVKNADLTNLLNAMNAKIDSLAHIVDSLSNLTPGGGDTPTAFTCGTDKVKDVDLNEYNTVAIGSQCWMKENLRTNVGGGVYPKYPNGHTKAGQMVDDSLLYGRLYTWSAMMKGAPSTNYPAGTTAADTIVHGICPAGWHVPSNAEWDTLTKYVFSKDEYKCGNDCGEWQAQSNVSCIAKALASKTGWNSNGTACNVGNAQEDNNATGFSAVPAGSSSGGFGIGASFWSATEYDGNGTQAWYRALLSGDSRVNRSKFIKNIGCSVRCLRDAGVGGTPGENETGGTTPSTPATMSCEQVMQCMGDTLGKLNDKIEEQGTEIQNLEGTVTTQGHTIDSLARIVDSLSNLTPGGGDTPTEVADGQPCPGAPTVSDGTNTYNTVKIGNQCWMKENLRTTTKRNNVGNVYTENTTAGYNAETYGYYYDWEAVMQNESGDKVQGICPTGWHVPSDAEWTALTDYVKSKAEYQCDGSADNIANALSSSTGWQSPSVCGPGHNSTTLNATGFSAVPAGRCFGGSFSDFGSIAYFWSATQSDAYAWCRRLNSGVSSVYSSGGADKDFGFSVRCLRDN